MEVQLNNPAKPIENPGWAQIRGPLSRMKFVHLTQYRRLKHEGKGEDIYEILHNTKNS